MTIRIIRFYHTRLANTHWWESIPNGQRCVRFVRIFTSPSSHGELIVMIRVISYFSLLVTSKFFAVTSQERALAKSKSSANLLLWMDIRNQSDTTVWTTSSCSNFSGTSKVQRRELLQRGLFINNRCVQHTLPARMYEEHITASSRSSNRIVASERVL